MQVLSKIAVVSALFSGKPTDAFIGMHLPGPQNTPPRNTLKPHSLREPVALSSITNTKWTENCGQSLLGLMIKGHGLPFSEKDFAGIKDDVLLFSNLYIKRHYPAYFYAPIHGDPQGYLTPQSVFKTEPAMMFLAKMGLPHPELKVLVVKSTPLPSLNVAFVPRLILRRPLQQWNRVHRQGSLYMCLDLWQKAFF